MRPQNNTKQPAHPTFSEFLKSTTPESAKQQIEQMIQSGQINEQQFNKAKEMAQVFASMFNIK